MKNVDSKRQGHELHLPRLDQCIFYSQGRQAAVSGNTVPRRTSKNLKLFVKNLKKQLHHIYFFSVVSRYVRKDGSRHCCREVRCRLSHPSSLHVYLASLWLLAVCLFISFRLQPAMHHPPPQKRCYLKVKDKDCNNPAVCPNAGTRAV